MPLLQHSANLVPFHYGPDHRQTDQLKLRPPPPSVHLDGGPELGVLPEILAGNDLGNSHSGQLLGGPLLVCWSARWIRSRVTMSSKCILTAKISRSLNEAHS